MKLTATLAIYLLLLGCSKDVPGPESVKSDGPSNGQTAARTTGDRFDARELQSLLRQTNSDTLFKALNSVKRLGVTQDGLSLLTAVWSEDRARYPELAWQVLKTAEVRLSIVDILQQAVRNGEISQQIEGTHDYAVSVLSSGTPNEVAQAAITLTVFDDESDVPALEKIAMSGDPHVSHSSIIALSRMCVRAADAALTRIESAASEADRAFLNDTRSRMANIKKQPGVCRS